MMRLRGRPQPDDSEARLREAAGFAITHASQQQRARLGDGRVTVQDVQIRALTFDLSVDEPTARAMLQERLKYRNSLGLGLTTDAWD